MLFVATSLDLKFPHAQGDGEPPTKRNYTMDSPFVGVIVIWPGIYAPAQWHYCNGTLLPINNNQVLYSLLGTQYGGDARTTFGLPDLRGRTVVGSNTMGNGPGLIGNYTQGLLGGTEITTLTLAQMPIHNHTATVTNSNTGKISISGITAAGQLQASAQPGSTNSPGNGVGPALIEPLAGSGDTVNAYATPDNTTTMPVAVKVDSSAAQVTGLSVGVTVGNNGASQPFSNLQPYTPLSYIIALQGLYPTRN
jgi:microcystin-dependent protein